MDESAKTKSDRSRKRILDAASTAFREHGIDRVGVRDVMKLAGLTRGGFYFHFPNKDALVAGAMREAARENADSHVAAINPLPREVRLQRFIERYLSEEHRDIPEGGCFVAALSGEMRRCEMGTRQAFAQGIDAVVDVIAGFIPGSSHAARRAKAEILAASMAGVMSVARSIPDRERSNEMLRRARRMYCTAFVG